LPARNGTESRRSSRVTLRVPVRIYEPGTNKRFGVGEAHSVKVSLWGGLLSLSVHSPVSRGQKLLLINENSGESKESHVVYLGPLDSNRRLVGVEFLEPSPSFWALTFPAVVPRRSPARSVEALRRAYA
jgi:hypothetical protein